MLSSVTLILLCQLLGESIVYLSGIPIPGPVVGMALLFCWLTVHKKSPEDLQTVAGFLHRYLALLFVPAGVGVISNVDFIRQAWAPITASLIIGTIITIAVTAVVMQKVNSLSAKNK